MLKKFILAVAILLMAVSAQAADLITSPYGLSNIEGLNLQADILYLPSTGNFGAGLGTNIATIYDVLDIRGEFVKPVDGDNTSRAGIGLGVNIPKLIGKLKGNFLLDNINASIGIVGLLNLDGNAHMEPGIYLTVIKVGL